MVANPPWEMVKIFAVKFNANFSGFVNKRYGKPDQIDT
jgi:hypothetical protein